MDPYLPLVFLFLFAAMIGGGFLLLAHWLGPARRNPEKEGTYECGIDPVGSPRGRFSVKFYLVAMLFILFDVEVVFLYPWAILFKEFVRMGAGPFLFAEMAVFLGILVIGLVYIYGSRALEWE